MAQLIFRTVELEAKVTEAQLQELAYIVENQETTDKEKAVKLWHILEEVLEEGIYEITIDDDHNVIVEDITDSVTFCKP